MTARSLAGALGFSCVAALAGAWGALALHFHAGDPWAAAFALLTLACLVGLFTRRRRAAAGLFALAFAAVLAFYATIGPRADRDWAPDVARQTRVEITGDRAIVTDTRAFDWSGAYEARPRWETRDYDLAGLNRLDIAFSTWGAPGIAHVMLSFGFEDGRWLVFSAEARRRRGEEYAPVASAFRNDEIVLVAADESDVFRVRTNFRGEEMRLYAVDARAPTIRRLFENYAAEANRLAARPQFYNSLTTNCSTVPWRLARAVGEGLPLDWRLFASTRADEYLHENGFLDRRRPFPELRARASITGAARAAGATDFSAAIRRGRDPPP